MNKESHSKRPVVFCSECGSVYYADASKMMSLCPQCASVLYGYKNCDHEFENGRCVKCFWDGSTSDYLKNSK